MSYYIKDSGSPTGSFGYESLKAFMAAVDASGRNCLPQSNPEQWEDLRRYLPEHALRGFPNGVVLKVDSEDYGYIAFVRSPHEMDEGIPLVPSEDIIGRNTQ